MKRATKKSCGVLDYLESTGLLERGTALEIKAVKKQYWAERRKEAKKQKRQLCSSYAVFLDAKEKRIIESNARLRQTSISAFIKSAALSVCGEDRVIDRIALGEIRELFSLLFSTIESSLEDQIILAETGEELLKQIAKLETKTITFLENQ